MPDFAMAVCLKLLIRTFKLFPGSFHSKRTGAGTKQLADVPQGKQVLLGRFCLSLLIKPQEFVLGEEYLQSLSKVQKYP